MTRNIYITTILILVISNTAIWCQSNVDWNRTGSSKSAIGQLENISGQKINRYGGSYSSNYDMNAMVTGMVAQSMVNALFNSNKSYPQVKEVKVSPMYLTMGIAGEQQRVQEALKVDRYNRLMKSYKFLKDSAALKYVKFKPKKNDLDKLDSAFMALQKKLIADRLKTDNEQAKKLLARLESKVPYPNNEKFNTSLKDLKPGDVLLFEPRYTNLSDKIQGVGVVLADGVGELLGTGNVNESKISHTITFLKEENGKRLYMDNMPNEGPVIIDENEMKKRYTGRAASVASLQNSYMAAPLNEAETEKLWDKAKEMATQNIELRKTQGYNSDMVDWENTMYGAWGKNNVVCSEASWGLIRATGRDLPLSKSWVTIAGGVDFSPSDFYNYKQNFLIKRINLTE
jgi:hypothetical protein